METTYIDTFCFLFGMRVNASAKSHPGRVLSSDTFETRAEMLINKQNHIPVIEHSNIYSSVDTLRD